MRGGKRQGAGRPLKSTIDNPRNTVKQIRWTAEEWEQIKTKSKEAGIDPSKYIRQAALSANPKPKDWDALAGIPDKEVEK